MRLEEIEIESGRYVNALDRCMRTLRKGKPPQKWKHEDFRYAKALAQIIMNRLSGLHEKSCQARDVEESKGPTIFDQLLYISALERCVRYLPKEKPKRWSDAEHRKAKKKAQVIFDRLSVFNDEPRARLITESRDPLPGCP
jgi:hypothetical protein